MRALSDQDVGIVLSQIDNEFAFKRVVSPSIIGKHGNTTLSVNLSRRDILSQRPGSYQLIRGKARLDAGQSGFGSVVEADCFVAYGHWERLSSVSAESVNIVEHLGHFFPNLPKARNAVGLFTCMNGIQNSLDDFEDMCESITSKLNREKPLFIGLYNPTSGKLFRILMIYSGLGMSRY